MTQQIVEGLFLIAMIALILTHATGFTNLVKAAGSTYTNLVKGLQGR